MMLTSLNGTCEQSLTETCEELWPETKEFLREMVGINSFTTNVAGVRAMGEAVARRFAPMGFAAEFVPHGDERYGDHLVLKLPQIESAPTVALIAHLDTVFPAEEEERNDFRWREEGDRVYGPGTNDIKGGIAEIFLVLEAFRRAARGLFEATNWVVLCNACEETDSDDFGGMCRAQLPGDTLACLLFEADGGEGDDFSLVTARNGRATFRVEVHGRGAHAGGGHKHGVNAIRQIGRVIEELEALTNYETGPTVNVGTVQGGTVMNRVPEVATADLEMRAFTTGIFNAAKARISGKSGPGDLRSRDEEGIPSQIVVTQLDETPPWPHNEASEALLAYWVAAGSEVGSTVGTERRGGLSDGNVLWSDFPTLDGLGPRGEHSHCSEDDPRSGKVQEYADVKSFVPKAVINVRALMALLSAS